MTINKKISARITAIIIMLISFSAPQTKAQEKQLRLANIPHSPYIHSENGNDTLVFPAGKEKFVPLFTQLHTLLYNRTGNVNILHIGGSHVQAGFLSHKIRTNLDSIANLPVANRGLIFPYKAIKTNAPYDYKITYTGNWNSTRCIEKSPSVPLGLSGAAATTNDPNATITIHTNTLGKWAPEDMIVLGKGTDKTATPSITHIGDSITISFKGLSDSISYSLRAVLPLTHHDGITYTASGINGAALSSWLRCSEFEDELSLLPPQLAILGIGVNDANVLPKDFKAEEFKEKYRQLISKILNVSPQCTFIFITNNDCWFNVAGKKRQFNTNTQMVQKAMYELAEEYGGAVFDVYKLMGGLGSSTKWVKAKLMKADHIHFTREGYEIIADILYNALAKEINRHNTQSVR